MNSSNETIVSGRMMEEMRKAGVDEGYVPVPKRLMPRAQRLLAGKEITSMDRRFRYLAKKERVKAGNRKREVDLAKARLTLMAEGILVQ